MLTERHEAYSLEVQKGNTHVCNEAMLNKLLYEKQQQATTFHIITSHLTPYLYLSTAQLHISESVILTFHNKILNCV